MQSLVYSIHYYPVKSLSFSNINKCTIKKKIGILNDRIFSFSKNLNIEKAKLIENLPNKRKLNNFLTLKNSPFLNKYKFFYEDNKLTLFKNNIKIISIHSEKKNEYKILCDKLSELEESLMQPIFLLRNKNFPFFDTTHSNNISNSISLININSILDLEQKIQHSIEFERFRSNFYIDGVDAWEERNWINKIIKINNISFKVQKHIPRCSATNLKPNTDNSTINLPNTLKKHYNHIDMGIYLTPLQDGEVNIGDCVFLDK